jgi:hypothetical protein
VCGYTDEEYRWFVENGHAGMDVVVQPNSQQQMMRNR